MFFTKGIFFLFISFFIGSKVFAEEVSESKKNFIDINYLSSKNELKDYILDTGDELYIQFENIPELSKIYKIDSEGEIYFERIKETYVRGLTILDLEILLEKRFAEFLVKPDLYIKINKFKPIRVVIKGEVKNPGFLELKPNKSNFSEIDNTSNNLIGDEIKSNLNSQLNSDKYKLSVGNYNKNSFKLTTAIKKAGGLTSYSDIKNIEIIRNNPIGKGGGKISTMII